MKNIPIALLTLILLFSCDQKPEKALSAEWEPTAYVWLQWDEGTYMGSEPVEHSLVELLTQITPHHKVRILKKGPEVSDKMKALFREHAIDESRIEWLNARGMAAITDAAPVFLKTGNGRFATVDFRWNNYGVREIGHPKTINTDTFDRQIAKMIDLEIVGQSELVWEGGAMDHNGKGTILFAEQWMSQRNPGWTKQQIEAELQEQLGIRQIIWLQNGPVEDDFKRMLPGGIYPFGTGGHVDEFCRFVNDSTILLAVVSPEEWVNGPIEQETYERMEANYAILQQARDPEGNPFQIIRVHTPSLIIKRIASSEIHPGDAPWFPGYQEKDSIGLVLASSYLNFLLTDKLVIAAKYWKPGRPQSMREKDQEVYILFQRIFPDKAIIQLNPETFNHQGGGFHCYTYNEPVR